MRLLVLSLSLLLSWYAGGEAFSSLAPLLSQPRGKEAGASAEQHHHYQRCKRPQARLNLFRGSVTKQQDQQQEQEGGEEGKEGEVPPSDYPDPGTTMSKDVLSTYPMEDPYDFILTGNKLLSRSHRTTRFLHRVLPIALQRKMRDSGFTKGVFNYGASVLAGGMALSKPALAWRHIRAGRLGTIHRYGPDPKQFVEVLPCKAPDSSRLLVFVHGGAWGSGAPWLYRLYGEQLTHLGFTVVVVGYRYYPEAGADIQVDDLGRALVWVENHLPLLGSVSSSPSASSASPMPSLYLCGHSSGAHIIALYLLRRASLAPSSLTYSPSSSSSSSTAEAATQGGGTGAGAVGDRLTGEQSRGGGRDGVFHRDLTVTGFIGLSGVYDIHKHYIYESSRGVHEVSPMKEANGGGAHKFAQYSPSRIVQSRFTKEQAMRELPDTLLLHGLKDETVPFSTTVEYHSVLGNAGVYSRCVLFPEGDHFDPVGDVMMDPHSEPATILLSFCHDVERRAATAAGVEGGGGGGGGEAAPQERKGRGEGVIRPRAVEPTTEGGRIHSRL